jgi:hypothetical protein
MYTCFVCHVAPKIQSGDSLQVAYQNQPYDLCPFPFTCSSTIIELSRFLIVFTLVMCWQIIIVSTVMATMLASDCCVLTGGLKHRAYTYIGSQTIPKIGWFISRVE